MKVIGIDLGGTKIAAATVNEKGRILVEKRVPTELAAGWPGLKRQIVTLCKGLVEEQGKVKAIGIGSAGPLHAPSGKLLDPTNFGWPAAVISLAKQLETSLKVPVRLENDAAAAVLAEYWKGGGGKNCVALTLGTGLGVGVIINGKLFRGARGLHPEAGHLVLQPGDRSALCGCGVYGCAEAYLSGVNFGRRGAERLKMPGISAKQLTELAKNGNAEALALFSEYSRMLAHYLLNMIVLFYPEKIILTGSFADAHALFLPEAEVRLRVLLERRLKTIPLYPKIALSRLGNRAGVLGGAYVALHKTY
jgi:glucokinase